MTIGLLWERIVVIVVIKIQRKRYENVSSDGDVRKTAFMLLRVNEWMKVNVEGIKGFTWIVIHSYSE